MSCRFTCLRRFTCLLLLCFASFAEAQFTNKATVFMGKGSGKCAAINGGSLAQGATIIQRNCDNVSYETWRIEPYADAFQVISNASGLCLNVSGNSQASGAAIIQWPCLGGKNELWTIESLNGYYRLRAKHSGKCLNVSGGSVEDNAPLIQWNCAGADNELWSFGDGFIPAAQDVRIISKASLNCIDVTGKSRAAGAKVITFTCAEVEVPTNQGWVLQRVADGYRFKVNHSGLCLAVTGASKAEGIDVEQRACKEGAEQIWYLRRSGRAFQIQNKNSMRCLDGTAPAIKQSACSATAGQTWQISTERRVGAWGEVIPTSLVPVAAALLKEGNVMLWSAYDNFTFGGDNAKTQTAVFDATTGSSTPVTVSNTGHDMFCPGTTMLADGRLLVNGGSSATKVSLYDSSLKQWSAAAPMKIGRGYNATTTLDNGGAFTIGGSWAGGIGGKDAEVWNSQSGWKLLPGAPATRITGNDPAGIFRADNHAWLFAVGEGRVFHAGPSPQMNWFSSAGTGSYTAAGNRGTDPYSMNGNAVLYDIGRILKVGGATAYSDVASGKIAATTNAMTIDIRTGVTAKPTGALAYGRSFGNAVVLPDGRVLVLGGQTHPIPFTDQTAILSGEIWNPASGTFKTVASMMVPRTYHSVALLLPDGRVLSAGGGLCGNCTFNHANLQLYSPDYLFAANGQPALRPVLTAAPEKLRVNTQIDVSTDRAVTAFSLVRLSSVTHTVNNDQRRIPLTIKSVAGTTATLLAPANTGVATPGYYMLFAIDGLGVPSQAKIVQVTP